MEVTHEEVGTTALAVGRLGCAVASPRHDQQVEVLVGLDERVDDLDASRRDRRSDRVSPTVRRSFGPSACGRGSRSSFRLVVRADRLIPSRPRSTRSCPCGCRGSRSRPRPRRRSRQMRRGARAAALWPPARAAVDADAFEIDPCCGRCAAARESRRCGPGSRTRPRGCFQHTSWNALLRQLVPMPSMLHDDEAELGDGLALPRTDARKLLRHEVTVRARRRCSSMTG